MLMCLCTPEADDHARHRGLAFGPREVAGLDDADVEGLQMRNSRSGVQCQLATETGMQHDAIIMQGPLRCGVLENGGTMAVTGDDEVIGDHDVAAESKRFRVRLQVPTH